MRIDARISSSQTFLMKVIFPTAWIIGFGASTLAMWMGAFHGSAGLPPPSWQALEFLAIWVLGTVVLLLSCTPLKRVHLDDHALRISNYLREITVPLHRVERITENRWINIHPVTVHFREDTDFGRRIVFMPKTRIFGLWSSHPVVAQLNGLVELARTRP